MILDGLGRSTFYKLLKINYLIFSYIELGLKGNQKFFDKLSALPAKDVKIFELAKKVKQESLYEKHYRALCNFTHPTHMGFLSFKDNSIHKEHVLEVAFLIGSSLLLDMLNKLGIKEIDKPVAQINQLLKRYNELSESKIPRKK